MEQRVDEAGAGGARRGHPQHFGVSDGLLGTASHDVIVVFCFNYRDRNVGLCEQHIVSALVVAAGNHLATNNNAPCRQVPLFLYLRLEVPTAAL